MTLSQFDAWSDGLQLPRAAASPTPVRVVVDDVKFPTNAWQVVRMCAFFGCRRPVFLSDLSGANSRFGCLADNVHFVSNCHAIGVGTAGLAALADDDDDPAAPHCVTRWVTLALSLHPPSAAVPVHDLHDVPWAALLPRRDDGDKVRWGLQVLVGQENGLSTAALALADRCVRLPQFGSVGSLSMASALGIILMHCHRHARCADSDDVGPAPGQRRLTALPARPETAVSGAGGHAATNAFYGGEKRPREAASDAAAATAANDDEDEEVTPAPRDVARIRASLASERAAAAADVIVWWCNAHGDRNLGATVRVANAYNAVGVAVAGKKKFNPRGALGCQLVTSVAVVAKDAAAAVDVAAWPVELVGSTARYGVPHVWALTQPWPFLEPPAADVPVPQSADELAAEAAPLLSLDDTPALLAAVGDAIAAAGGRRPLIVLAVPEEGRRLPAALRRAAHRRVVVTRASAPSPLQRGLPGAIAAAIALERIRFAIRTFPLP